MKLLVLVADSMVSVTLRGTTPFIEKGAVMTLVLLHQSMVTLIDEILSHFSINFDIKQSLLTFMLND